MIELTRLNGSRLAVNSELIQFAESAGDTLLTLVTGEKLIVMESLQEVTERMEAYRARTIAEAARQCGGLVPVAGAALPAVEALHAVARSDETGAVDEECAERMRRRRRAEA